MEESKCLDCGAVLPALNIDEDTSPVAFLFASGGRACAQCALKRTITMKTRARLTNMRESDELVHKLQALVRPAKVPTVEIRVENDVSEIYTKPAGVRVIIRTYNVEYLDPEDLDHDNCGRPCYLQEFGVEEEY